MKQPTKWLDAALIALGLKQAAWAANVPDFRETLQAAERGDAHAQALLGNMYANGRDVRQDYAEAVRWYRQAAEQGHAVAQKNLGVMYYEGRGVRQDDAEAVRWYRQAAAQGFAAAQTLLGMMYENGRGVHQDLALAQEWFGKACQNGDQDGCDNYQRLKAGY